MRIFRRLSAAFLTASLALAGLIVAAVTVAAPAAAFPATNKQVVIDYLRSISGTSIVSGQHNKEPANQPGQYTADVHAITGEWPGLWGGDMMFTATDAQNRQQVVNQAINEWNNGSLVALTWHVCPPTGPATCNFDGGVKSSITDQQFQDIVTGGTTLNNTWRQRMEQIVPYLQQLRDAGVPVLWRPFHEMNETWNWWGNRPGANGGAKIFQQMKDYFDSRGLDNLIWVWNVQDNPNGNWAQYYPGDNYVDVVSLDVWYKNHPSSSDYQQMLGIAGNKPIAIAEMGKMPTDALLTSQPRWAYFMLWSEQLRGKNSNQEIQNAYWHPRVLNQGEINLAAGGGNNGGGTMPPPTGGAGTGAIVGLAGKCVDVAGSGTSNGTAVQLYDCAPGTAQTWEVRSDGTIRNPNSDKCLDVAGQNTANGTPLQIWGCNGQSNQQWSYQSNTQRLVSASSGRCLDVTGQNSANATRLQIWDCNTQSNQRWTLPSGSNGGGTPAVCTRPGSSGDRTLTVNFNGTNYSVPAYVPAGLSATRTVPLVFNLHGSGSTGTGQLSYSGMRATADSGKFIILAPNGAQSYSGGYSWTVPGIGSGPRDDIAFLDAVRSTALQQLCGDPERVYFSGYSGGGRMASAYACARPDNVTALAAVAGLRAGAPNPNNRSQILTSSCQPSSAVPVIAFHGQQDWVNTYNAGGSEYWGYSVPLAQQRWAQLNGCTASPHNSWVSTNVTRTTYGSCRDSAEVVLYTVADGGHTWPGSSQDNGNGKVTQEINANTLMWAFFQTHQ